MNDQPEIMETELICVIVNYGTGSKIIKFAKQHGISGGTIFLGKGTIKNRVLELLDLSDVRKEIVIMGAEKSTAYTVLDELDKKFAFHKPHHGIAFNTSITRIIGTSSIKCGNINKIRGEENIMINAICVIVDKGKAEDVVEAATKAGARGGTIINARGSGIHETSKLFSMDIEPEKEIVLILAENSITEAIVSSIKEKLEIDKPGNGIIFIQHVDKAYGLY